MTRVEYHPGKFLPAYRVDAGELNEWTEVWFDQNGTIVVCRQIVGILARRIVTRLTAGQSVGARGALRRHEVRIANRPVPAALGDDCREGRRSRRRRGDDAGDAGRVRRAAAARQRERRRDARAPRRDIRRGVSLLPSLFTLANLFCGWSCVVHAMRGELETAAPFIGVAVVLDMLDGRIARMTGTTSEFGVQLDSLADLISFGMAPAVLAFAWGLAPLGRLGGASASCSSPPRRCAWRASTSRRTPTSATSSASRARPPRPSSPPRSSTTRRACSTRPEAFLGVVLVIVPALLMVSTIRFRSFKTIDIGERRGYQILIFLAALFALIVTYPHEVLLIMAYSYLASAFVGLALHKLRRRSFGAPHTDAHEVLDGPAES